MEIWILVILVGVWSYGDMDLSYISGVMDLSYISGGMDLWRYGS